MAPRVNCSARSNISRALQRTTKSQRPMIILSQSSISALRTYATASTSQVPAGILRLPDNYIPPTQPPSSRRPELRKSQLLRSYTSLLRSSPIILLLQHNNITAVEWAAIRRELRAALAKVPTPAVGPNDTGVPVNISSAIEMQVIRSRLFSVAMKIVEFFNAEAQASKSNAYSHDLSATAYETISNVTPDENSAYAQINPLLVGPVAVVTFPAVSPAHLAAALSVLAPSPAFPAPSRKKYPGYHDPITQSGLQKLLLVGGRVEGRVFDNDGVRWVGGIAGGVDGLRAQLVNMLQSAGLGLTTALEGHSKGLWLALESRRTQLEEEAGGGAKKEGSEDEKGA
ncbi:uncharacterized protein F4822DRAFT_421670 [Hypoxylon trugodes]|uniref:uncharacterized protein n=1 Tax=Hypoxylon trugodes TaxID=326681 RepID=UPI00219CD78D|nr:uncharacterized protein F4822DRAFT_421670 [Hypoxylon trugodes]KAI1382947.1 hypothetical protein F4822DRAFT_421670 [Hypoxylon trugodes]